MRGRSWKYLAAFVIAVATLPESAVLAESSEGLAGVPLEIESVVLERLSWASELPTMKPAFFPIGVLKDEKWRSLDLELEPKLERKLTRRKASFRMADSCNKSLRVYDPASDARPALDYLREIDGAVGLGTVLATVPGWDARSVEVRTLVYLRVDRLLRGFNDLQAEKGRGEQIVLASIPEGRIEMGGVVLCRERDPAYLDPAPGAEVLFFGRPEEARPFPYLSGSLLFVEGDGLFAIPPLASFSDRGGIHRDDLLAAFAEVSQ